MRLRVRQRFFVALFSTLLAVGLGVVIAYRSAKSITAPLTNLMKSRGGLGTPAIWNTTSTSTGKMKSANWRARLQDGCLPEGDGRSLRGHCGGDLNVEVQPRSNQDTLGNAFARMVEGLGGLVRSVRDALPR